MELSDRKKKILRAIVDLYIRTAEPVASKTYWEAACQKIFSKSCRGGKSALFRSSFGLQP